MLDERGNVGRRTAGAVLLGLSLTGCPAGDDTTFSPEYGVAETGDSSGGATSGSSSSSSGGDGTTSSSTGEPSTGGASSSSSGGDTDSSSTGDISTTTIGGPEYGVPETTGK